MAELDRDIVGQAEAKRAVAIALRNRWRRRQLPDELRGQVTPKNIMLIGPTGVGKTEIARRLAKLVGAPFVKVEATKYTEVGYVGRDVESLVRDLVEAAIVLVQNCRAAEGRRAGQGAGRAASARPAPAAAPPATWQDADTPQAAEAAERRQRSREKMKARLEAGELEDREVEVTLPGRSMAPVSILGAGNLEQMEMDLQGMFEKIMPKQSQTRRMTVGEARPILLQQEIESLIDPEKINQAAVNLAEESGIVFIDEIDKIAGDEGARPRARRLAPGRPARPAADRRGNDGQHQVRAGQDRPRPVHRGRSVSSIQAVGPDARASRPVSDPRRDARPDPRRLRPHPPRAARLADPPVPGAAGDRGNHSSNSPTPAIEAMADLAYQVNQSTQNIGARRLHTILERVLEELSFDASDRTDKHVVIDEAHVRQRLEALSQDEDLSRFIL